MHSGQRLCTLEMQVHEEGHIFFLKSGNKIAELCVEIRARRILGGAETVMLAILGIWIDAWVGTWFFAIETGLAVPRARGVRSPTRWPT